MSVSDERLAQIERENYTDLVHWLQDENSMDLVTETKDKRITSEEKKAFIKEAKNALKVIIETKWTCMMEDVTSEIESFRQACRDGGVNVKEPRAMFREQARRYYKLSLEDQQLAEREVEITIKMKMVTILVVVV